VFFQNFAYGSFQMRSTSAALTGNQQWPFHVITKCEAIPDEKERFRKFKPRSDLLVSKSNLPRLLVEVNSKPRQNWPEDLVQMLLTGAAVVRLANRFLDRRFMAAKNFVLCAIYVWDAGEVSRYLLSEELYNPVVRYKVTNYRLDTSLDCAQFVRQLYNLRDVLEREEAIEDTAWKIWELIKKIEKHNKGRIKTFHSKETPGPNNAQGNKRPRLNSDVGDRGAGGGAGGADSTDCAELGAMAMRWNRETLWMKAEL